MIEPMMDLRVLAEKSGDADLLRKMIGLAIDPDCINGLTRHSKPNFALKC